MALANEFKVGSAVMHFDEPYHPFEFAAFKRMVCIMCVIVKPLYDISSLKRITINQFILIAMSIIPV